MIAIDMMNVPEQYQSVPRSSIRVEDPSKYSQTTLLNNVVPLASVIQQPQRSMPSSHPSAAASVASATSTAPVVLPGLLIAGSLCPPHLLGAVGPPWHPVQDPQAAAMFTHPPSKRHICIYEHCTTLASYAEQQVLAQDKHWVY